MDNEFNTNGFRIIRNIIDVSDWYKKAKTQESIGQYDNQSPNSPSVYNGLNELQEIIKPIIEEKTELDLYKTYNYFRIYKNGAILSPHIDRDACEISVSLNLGGDDWDIGIFDYNNIPHTTLLKTGDALIYRGCDLLHWRPSKFKGDELIQAFIHFVDKNGSRTSEKAVL